jgi:hypothetical protein
VSLFIHAYLLDKYGPRLTLKQLAEVLQVSDKGLQNRIRRLPLRTYVDQGQRFADVRDVVQYLDDRRENAETQAAG